MSDKPLPKDQKAAQDLQDRVTLFDRDFQVLQNKYQLRAVAQVIFPGGAVLSVPIQVFPFPASAAPQGATDASK